MRMKVTESSVGSRKLTIRSGSKEVIREYYCSDVSANVLPSQAQSKKRAPVTILENPMEKKRKMDRGKKRLFANMFKFETKKCVSGNNNEKLTQGTRILMEPSSKVQEKQHLGKDLKELLRGKTTTQKRRIMYSLKESIDLGIGAVDDDDDDGVLREPKRITNKLSKVAAPKIEDTKGSSQTCSRPLFGKYVGIGDVSGVSCSSTTRSITSKAGSCGTGSLMNYRCSISSNKVHQPCKKFASEKLKKSGQKDAYTTDRYLKKLTASGGDRLDSEDNVRTPGIDVNIMSPKRALRVAMLKTRFADTILKARLQHQDGKADPARLQGEKDKLKKQFREEKARIEAQILAAESELKMQREREREAARIALEQVERTVYIDDSLKFLRDLELMSRSPDSDCSIDGSHGNPLERLGLYIKEDFVEDDDDVEEAPASSEDEIEEGEILN